jgi:phosphoglycolate phosphatase-like HAD superfamily hydrolase
MKSLIADHIKAVVFDFDDTLVGTIEAKWAAHKHVAKKYYDKELSDEDIRPHWGVPLRTLVGLLYGDTDLDRAMEREAAHNSDFPKVIFDETVRTLQALKAAGKHIGIVTATSRRNLENDLDITGISRQLIDYTQTEDDTDYHKPDPRVFEPTVAWLSGLSVQPAEALYVGDGVHDMKAALGAGFGFIGVATGLVTQEDFQVHGAQSVQTLGQLIDNTPDPHPAS